MITAIATELDGMSSMLYDMDKWFTQFEREDMVAQATQFEYTHSVEISTELMNELEHLLFWCFYITIILRLLFILVYLHYTLVLFVNTFSERPATSPHLVNSLFG